MPGIDLSTLNGPDLRRLLKIAHSRNDGALADKLEWEIASRGAGIGRPGGPFPPPADDDADEPAFPMAASDPEPFVLEPRAQEPAPARSGLVLLSVGVLAGCLLSGSVFWGLQRMDRSPALGRAPPPAPRAMAVRRAAPAPPPPALAQPGADQVAAALAPGPFPPRPELIAPQPEPVAPIPAPTAPVEAVVPPVTPPVEVATEEPPPKPARTERAAKKAAALEKQASLKKSAAKQVATRAARTERTARSPPPTVRLAKAEPAAHKSTARDPCTRSTPADRLVCRDLSLRLIDLELREAYVRALNARADPAIVDAGQAAWRRTRDKVSDPDRLARLYNQRIRELEAATAAARASRPPG
jgi:hypothetical protein